MPRRQGLARCGRGQVRVSYGLARDHHGFMAHARKALIIAPDDVPGEYGNYAAACQALNLEPNEQHCYVVCRVSTATGPRTLLTVDLDLLQDTEKAGTSDQASLLSAGRSKETASGEPFAASGLEPETTTQVDREAAPSSWEVAYLEGTELDKVLGRGAELREIKLIRGRIFYDESTQDLWVERDILLLPPSERSEILEWIQGEGTEGVAEYMATQVDAVLSQSQLFHFATGSVGGLDLAALDAANLQDGWHEFFIGGPTEKLASALGLPGTSLIEHVAGSLPLPFDRLMGGFKLACEISAVATVMVTGPTPLVLVGEKLLVKDVAHRLVVESIKDLLPRDGEQRRGPDRHQEPGPETTIQVDREAAPKENVKPEEPKEPEAISDQTGPEDETAAPRSHEPTEAAEPEAAGTDHRGVESDPTAADDIDIYDESDFTKGLVPRSLPITNNRDEDHLTGWTRPGTAPLDTHVSLGNTAFNVS